MLTYPFMLPFIIPTYLGRHASSFYNDLVKVLEKSPLTGFDLRISRVGSDHSTNCPNLVNFVLVLLDNPFKLNIGLINSISQ